MAAERGQSRGEASKATTGGVTGWWTKVDILIVVDSI